MPRNRQLTEARIRDAAAHLLDTNGFESWGVNAVAREAGVDKVLLYRYFNSLDGLLDAVINATEFWPHPDTLPTDSLTAFLEETMRRMREDRHPWVILARPGMMQHESPANRKFRVERERWIQGLIRYTRGSGKRSLFESLALVVFASVSLETDNESSLAFWEDFADQVEWITKPSALADGELPVELL